MKKALALLFSLALAMGIFAQESEYIPGQFIIQIKADASANQIAKDLGVLNGQITGLKARDELSRHMRAWLFDFNSEQVSEYELENALALHPDVQLIQRNHIVKMRETTPNDEQFSDQWHHVNGNNDADIDSDLAWDITTGGTTALGDEIVVCVIEGGNLLHVDLDPNRWVNENEIPDDNIDNDNNGYIDDYLGWNVQSEDDDGVFQGGHGTNVAGMIGAVGDNEEGVAGINWDVKIMSVTGESLGDEASVIEAYDYPLTQRILYQESGGALGAFVVATNASWGIDNGDPATIPLWCAFYDTLGVHGILNCGATANNNVNIDQVGDIPTGCTSPYMVSVTATNNNDERTFSAFGVENVDLGAPGESVWTTSGNDSYTSTSGTSFASPLTAGAIALLYSVPCPSLISIAQSSPQTAADLILDALYEGVDPVAGLDGFVATGGRLNVFNSLNILLDNCSSSECLIPFGVSSETADGVNYTISWGAIESMESFDFRYREVGADEWTTIEGLTETSYNLIDLLWCTDYEFQLSANCGEDMSDWSSSYFISTDGCCESPLSQNIQVNNITETSATITWPPVLAAESYEVTVLDGDVGTVYEDIINEELVLENLNPCASYEVTVQTICIDEIFADIEGSVSFNTFGCGACTDNSFCPAEGNPEDEYIENFSIADINNTSGPEADGYGDYTNFSTELERSGEYQVVMAPGFVNFEYSEYFIVWIDMNQDGEFTSDEIIFESEDGTAQPQSSIVTIPEDAPLGNTRLRVSMKYSGGFFFTPQGPCDELSYGEIEDYCVDIIEETIGVFDSEKLVRSVYPNPSTGNFIMSFENAGNYSIQIFDLNGREVKRESIYGNRYDLDLSSQPEGMYSYRVIESSGYSVSGKLVLLK